MKITGLYFENPQLPAELIVLMEGSTLSMKSCTFRSIKTSAVISSVDSLLAMEDCLFESIDSLRGGIILTINSELAIKDSFFDSMTIQNSLIQITLINSF